MTETRFWCEWGWLGGNRPAHGVLVFATDGLISAVVTGEPKPPRGSRVLRGLVLNGVANAHSHVFQRALRGRMERGRGNFWTWRDLMYRAASALEPDLLHRLARAVYAEMLESGFTAVGEFHYVHHPLGGGRYRDPNIMGEALVAAATEAGVRLTLLDTLYLHGGLSAEGYVPLGLAQARFGDGTVEQWAERTARLTAAPGVVTGAAAHSVRAVDPHSLATLASVATERNLVVHAHVSEQPAENIVTLEHHGLTPTKVLERAGILGPRFTAVHGIHLSPEDSQALGSSGSTVCLCPTTEANLGDGVGKSVRLLAAGARLCVGSDSQAVVDPLAEARAVEMHERLVSGVRGVHDTTELLAALTTGGYRSLGRSAPDGEPHDPFSIGAPCDLVAVGLGSTRLSGHDRGSLLEAVVFSATASDVTDVVVDGRVVVNGGRHVTIDVAAELTTAIEQLWDRAP